MPDFTGTLKALTGIVLANPVRGTWERQQRSEYPTVETRPWVHPPESRIAGKFLVRVAQLSSDLFRYLQEPNPPYALALTIPELGDLAINPNSQQWVSDGVEIGFYSVREIGPTPPSIAVLEITCDFVECGGFAPEVVAWFREKVAEERKRQDGRSITTGYNIANALASLPVSPYTDLVRTPEEYFRDGRFGPR